MDRPVSRVTHDLQMSVDQRHQNRVHLIAEEWTRQVQSHPEVYDARLRELKTADSPAPVSIDSIVAPENLTGSSSGQFVRALKIVKQLSTNSCVADKWLREARLRDRCVMPRVRMDDSDDDDDDTTSIVVPKLKPISPVSTLLAGDDDDDNDHAAPIADTLVDRATSPMMTDEIELDLSDVDNPGELPDDAQPPLRLKKVSDIENGSAFSMEESDDDDALSGSNSSDIMASDSSSGSDDDSSSDSNADEYKEDDFVVVDRGYKHSRRREQRRRKKVELTKRASKFVDNMAVESDDDDSSSCEVVTAKNRMTKRKEAEAAKQLLAELRAKGKDKPLSAKERMRAIVGAHRMDDSEEGEDDDDDYVHKKRRDKKAKKKKKQQHSSSDVELDAARATGHSSKNTVVAKNVAADQDAAESVEAVKQLKMVEDVCELVLLKRQQKMTGGSSPHHQLLVAIRDAATGFITSRYAYVVLDAMADKFAGSNISPVPSATWAMVSQMAGSNVIRIIKNLMDAICAVHKMSVQQRVPHLINASLKLPQTEPNGKPIYPMTWLQLEVVPECSITGIDQGQEKQCQICGRVVDIFNGVKPGELPQLPVLFVVKYTGKSFQREAKVISRLDMSTGVSVDSSFLLCRAPECETIARSYALIANVPYTIVDLCSAFMMEMCTIQGPENGLAVANQFHTEDVWKRYRKSVELAYQVLWTRTV